MRGSNGLPLSLNLLTIGLFAAAIWHCTRPIPAPPPPVEPAPAQEQIAIGPALKPRMYSELGSTNDWQAWIDQLRAQGVPTPVLARLLQAGFEERWKKKQAEVQAAFMRNEIDTAGMAVLGNQHDRQEENEVRALLGDAEFKRYDMQIVLRSLPLRNVQLAVSEAESMYAIEKKLQHLAQDLNERKLKGELGQTEYESQIQKAQAERDEQLKAVLGEQRYSAMYPPPNEAAQKLAKDLKDVALPADVSFDALVNIQTQWNERRGEAQQRLQEAKAGIARCEDELGKINSVCEMEYQRVLGANTHDASMQDNDRRGEELKRHARDWALNDAELDYICRTIQYYDKVTADYQRQTRALEAKGETVDWDQVNKNLKQFTQQTEESLQDRLGRNRFEALKENNIIPSGQERPTTN